MLAAKGVRARATALARRSPRPLARNHSTRSPNELALEQPHGSLSRELPLQQIGVSDPRRTGLTGDER